jgi:acyl-CoA synthetase (AMP-forming)/AMP-acid ligase II
VVVGHDELLLHMESMSRALPVAREGMTGVSWLPLHHDMGLIGGLLFPLYNGFPIHLLSPLDFRSRPFSWLEALSEFRAGITPGPPSAYSLALRLAARASEAKLDLSALECAMIGAEPISARLVRAFSEAFAPCGFRPEAFFPVYGLAEATVAVTFPPLLAPTRVESVSRSGLERDGVAAPPQQPDDLVEWVGVGSAIPNSEIKIVDDQGGELGERHVGEILVKSKTLFRGYFDDPGATRDAVVDGWLRTGDLGYVAGGHLFVTGRRKDIIIKGGHNLVPAVIEELVSSVEGVRTGCVAAIGIHVPALETEEIWVVAETKLEPSEHRDLSHRVRDALKRRGIAVDRIRLVEPGTLPKTTSGKIQRTLVRDEVRSSMRAEPGGSSGVSEA